MTGRLTLRGSTKKSKGHERKIRKNHHNGGGKKKKERGIKKAWGGKSKLYLEVQRSWSEKIELKRILFALCALKQKS